MKNKIIEKIWAEEAEVQTGRQEFAKIDDSIKATTKAASNIEKASNDFIKAKKQAADALADLEKAISVGVAARKNVQADARDVQKTGKEIGVSAKEIPSWNKAVDAQKVLNDAFGVAAKAKSGKMV